MKSSYITAFALIVLAVVWMLSGVFKGGESAAIKTPQEIEETSEQIMRVRVQLSEAAPVVNDIVVTGRSQASRTVELRAETAGQVEEVFFEEGAKVNAGDLLARLEVNDREERVEEARALVQQREIEYNAASKLETKGFNSKIRLSEAKAALQSAQTLLRKAEIDLAKTRISAPFDGMLSVQAIELGDYVSIGSPLYQIVDLDPVEFTGYVSESNIAEVREGQSAAVILLNGPEVEGLISFVAPAADPQTRTFRTVVSVENPELMIREGLTAEIRIPLSDVQAHKISPSVLTLNDEGRVGVNIVGEDDQVKFVPVEIIADLPGYMLIDGLPSTARIITVGQEFVIPGQKVEPVMSEDEELL